MDWITRRPSRSSIAVTFAIVAGTAMLPISESRAEVRASNSIGGTSRPEEVDVTRAKKLVTLGDQYARGKGVPRDDAEAARLYQQAADFGDLTGKARLGEALINGRGLAADLPRGLGLIKEAADGGNGGAMVLLGDLTVKGLAGKEDRARGADLLAAAADKGQLVALVKLGAIYEWGALGNRDPHKAAAYYREAIAAGRADAMVALGRMYVEGRAQRLGNRAEGVSLLRQAQELGNENAVVALSECYLKGQGVARDPRKALSLLEAAWQAGNTKAGLKLLALYRDGRKGSVRPDITRAQVYRSQLSQRLPAHELRSEALLIKARLATTKSARNALLDEFSEFPVSDRAALLRRVRGTNLNLYVSLVQVELRRLGLFRRAPTGLLSKETVGAIYKHCIRYEEPAVCRKGPLTPRVLEVTALIYQGGSAGVERKKVNGSAPGLRDVEKARMMRQKPASRVADVPRETGQIRSPSVRGRKPFIYGAVAGSDLANPH